MATSHACLPCDQRWPELRQRVAGSAAPVVVQVSLSKLGYSCPDHESRGCYCDSPARRLRCATLVSDESGACVSVASHATLPRCPSRGPAPAQRRSPLAARPPALRSGSRTVVVPLAPRRALALPAAARPSSSDPKVPNKRDRFGGKRGGRRTVPLPALVQSGTGVRMPDLLPKAKCLLLSLEPAAFDGGMSMP
eukprot:scaffold7385_cov533-Prasinococcus_capsulatus_cf.AAC.4